MRPCRSSSMKKGPTTLSLSKTISPPWRPPLKPCFRRTFPPQVVTLEVKRRRRERRAIATRTVTPEQIGLAGAQQLAQVQRTRSYPGSAFVAENLNNPTALAARSEEHTSELQSLRHL